MKTDIYFVPATASKMVAPLITSKKVLIFSILPDVRDLLTPHQTVSNIQKWNQVQEELKDDPNARVPVCKYLYCNASNVYLIMQVPQSNPPPSATATLVSSVPSRAPSLQPVEAEFEFSDTTALTCLLCARAFKTLDQLKRHNKESDLHKARHLISSYSIF